MKKEERIMNILKKRLGYNDKDFNIFKNNPRNKDIISKINQLSKKLIVLEVIESHGCNSGHKTGDKFYFDAVGNLITNMSPNKICSYSLNSALMMIFTANEMLFAGIDPNQIRFKRANCFDVGIQCGGWGKIVLELNVIDKESI